MSDDPEVLPDLEPRYRRYLGIPRHLIPWYPAVDENLCTGCQECIKFCHDGVYRYDEQSNTVAVDNPWHCQVYCQSCTHACSSEAITFPGRRELKEAIRALRTKYPPA